MTVIEEILSVTGFALDLGLMMQKTPGKYW